MTGGDTGGFDHINVQPGYAYTEGATEARFQLVDDEIHDWGLTGPHLELGSVTNSVIPADQVVNSGRAYLRAADRYDWPPREMTTYYYGSPIADHATIPSRRELYDGLYRHIQVNPRVSLLTHDRRVATADTFVEDHFPTRTHGADNYLNLGTNSAPNALRSYLPGLPWS